MEKYYVQVMYGDGSSEGYHDINHIVYNRDVPHVHLFRGYKGLYESSFRKDALDFEEQIIINTTNTKEIYIHLKKEA